MSMKDENQQKNNDELELMSDDELEQVAGGRGMYSVNQNQENPKPTNKIILGVCDK